MNGQIKTSLLLVYWLHTNRFCWRKPAVNWKTETEGGSQQSTEIKYKVKKLNGRGMTTDIQRQADSIEESVYSYATSSDHSSRKQTERQVCYSEWRGCLEDTHLMHCSKQEALTPPFVCMVACGAMLSHRHDQKPSFFHNLLLGPFSTPH